LSSTNQTRDTNAGDYLNDVRLYLAQLKAKSIRTVDATLTILRQLLSQVGFASATPTATAYTLADYDVVDNTGKCIVYLPFDLDTLDASNSNDGTVSGTETYVDGPEISSTHPMRKAFSFNASTYITLANESNFDLDRTNTMSFSFWYQSSDTGQKGIFTKARTASDYAGIYVEELNGIYGVGFKLGFTDGTNTISRHTNARYNDGLWYHIVWTYDGSNTVAGIKFYMNGVLTSTTIHDNGAPINTILHNQLPVVGGSDVDGAYGGTFKLKDFSMWNVELSQDDVTRLSGGRQISKDTTATNPAYLSFSDVT